VPLVRSGKVVGALVVRRKALGEWRHQRGPCAPLAMAYAPEQVAGSLVSILELLRSDKLDGIRLDAAPAYDLPAHDVGR
jgi:hypothetical protein